VIFVSEELDSFDLQIIDQLEREGFKKQKIANKIGLSRYTISRRIKALFQKGIINGGQVILNPLLQKNARITLAEFKTNPHEPWIARSLKNDDNCDILYGITGDYSLFARFKLYDEMEFNKFLKRIDIMMSNTLFKKYQFIHVIECFKENQKIIKEKPSLNHKLDKIDRIILQVLKNQQRFVAKQRPMTSMDVSRVLTRMNLPLSQPAVFRRIQRLKQIEIILKEGVRIDYHKLGFQTRFIMKVKVNPRVYSSMAREKLAPMKEITDLYRTNEDYGLLAFVLVRDVNNYNSFLTQLYNTTNVIDTYSTLVLENQTDKQTISN
jgi:DNA-binding Lrp family transcriptional regulator